ncbi:hypothetical protein BGZ47_000668 [Haplosporangium gracile]|nr:hypothetical protein BGZ47_000668 [Haplosporangium gracile]
MSNNTNTKTPPTVTTTIITTNTGSGVTLLANMLQGELNLKLIELNHIYEAYSETLGEYQEDKPALPKNRGHTVQVCWELSIKWWQYIRQLGDAVVKLEAEIALIRREILDAMVAHHRSGPAPVASSE